MSKSRIHIGEEVVAISFYSFSSIEIYGIGTLLTNTMPYKVQIGTGKDAKIVQCPIICRSENWCELVNDTEAQVKRIAFQPRKTKEK